MSENNVRNISVTPSGESTTERDLQAEVPFKIETTKVDNEPIMLQSKPY